MCFPGGASGKEPLGQRNRHKRFRFHPWVGKIPCRRVWQPAPVSCLTNPTEELGGLQFIESQSQTWLKLLGTHICTYTYTHTFKIFIHSAANGLSCGMEDLCDMWTLGCSMWDPVPWPGIKARSPALAAWSLSHWTTKEVLPCCERGGLVCEGRRVRGAANHSPSP